MKLTEFNTKREEYGIEGTGITSKTRKELTWTDKITGEVYVIPTGETVHIWFSPRKHSTRLFIQHNDEVKITRNTLAFTGIIKEPGIKTLEKWSNDGVCKSLTGCRVEPDGWGPDGAPSWMLVAGVI